MICSVIKNMMTSAPPDNAVLVPLPSITSGRPVSAVQHVQTILNCKVYVHRSRSSYRPVGGTSAVLDYKLHKATICLNLAISLKCWPGSNLEHLRLLPRSFIAVTTGRIRPAAIHAMKSKRQCLVLRANAFLHQLRSPAIHRAI